MALVSIIQKDATTVFKTYKNKAGKDAAFVLETKIPGLPASKKIILCDENGNPMKLKDITKDGMDIYERTQDGLTMLTKEDGQKIKLPKIFYDVCAMLFHRK